MPITFKCPLCRSSVKVSRKHAGMQSRCAGCSGSISIPTLSEAAALSTAVLAVSGEGTESADLIERKRLEMELAAIRKERDALARERDLLEGVENEADEAAALDELVDEEEAAVLAAYEKAREDARARERAARLPDIPAHLVEDVEEVEEPDEDGRVPCPDCCEDIKAGARVCRFCGWKATGRRVAGNSKKGAVRSRFERRSLAVRMRGEKSPLLAGFLSLLVVGLGQVYVGKAERGIMFFLAAVVLAFVGLNTLGVFGLLAGWAVLFWSVADAYSEALKA